LVVRAQRLLRGGNASQSRAPGHPNWRLDGATRGGERGKRGRSGACVRVRVAALTVGSPSPRSRSTTCSVSVVPVLGNEHTTMSSARSKPSVARSRSQ
jgi:hypothetical protein